MSGETDFKKNWLKHVYVFETYPKKCNRKSVLFVI